MERSGTYVVIEGNDGTGKSTQVKLLTEYLLSINIDAVMIEEPGSEDPEKATPVANYLRSVIKNGEFHRDPEIDLALFSAARRELWLSKIAPALERGAFVLSSRNYFSTMAYQGKGSGLDLRHIIETTRLFTDERYMQPDSMIILTLDDEAERAKRITNRGIGQTPDTFESKGLAFQALVNKAYTGLAEQYDIPTISCLDGTRSKSIDEIQSAIRSQLSDIVATDT